MLSKWKAGFAAAAVSVAMIGGVGVSAAHANDDDIFQATYIGDDQWNLQNVSGMYLTITDMQWASGDIQEVYHWNFGCLWHALHDNDSCTVWGDSEGTSGVLDVTTTELGDVDVDVVR